MEITSRWLERPLAMHTGCNLPLKRVKVGMQVTAIMLADRVDAVMTHWSGRTKQPCTGDQTCLRCLNGVELRCYAFLHVHVIDPADLECILELPAVAADQMQRWKDQIGNIRGREVTFRRPPGRITAPVTVMPSDVLHDVTSRPAIDPRPVVDAIFSCRLFHARTAGGVIRDEIASAM